MSTFISEDLRAGIAGDRTDEAARLHRLRVRAGKAWYPVLQRWPNGFSVATDTAPEMRGFVDLYDGDRHLCRCLVFATDESAGEVRFEFKRQTVPLDRPPADFATDDDNAPPT
jgi:hypothetical protein